jgi:hypothetical protein
VGGRVSYIFFAFGFGGSSSSSSFVYFAGLAFGSSFFFSSGFLLPPFLGAAASPYAGFFESPLFYIKAANQSLWARNGFL